MPAPLTSTRTAPVRHEVRPGTWLDSRRAVWLEREGLLLVSDLHWGYAASHRARGNLVPLWGDAEIAERLDALITAYAPREMIWLGDVVHAAEGAAGAESFLRETRVPVTLIAGNHDRHWRQAGTRSVTRGRFHFHHGDSPLALPPGTTVEVVGHHHPAVLCGDQAGSRLKLPALVASERRLILPAFSPWAAGTPWNDFLDTDDVLWAIAPQRIFPLPRLSRANPSPFR
jgi:uncharacterized protein